VSGRSFSDAQLLCAADLGDTVAVCQTAADTQKFASKVAELLPANSSLALIGDLGSGKTTFVQGLASGFNCKSLASSPSFNLVNTYAGDAMVVHVDAYRLDGSQLAADSLMLWDILIPPYCLAVEWPELLPSLKFFWDFEVFFETRNDGSRKIIMRHAKTS
jgi:tRNA threonylcarbamoyladenosine biosynthesis protein TsaE